jgi:Concanavalin A-like lectin/glucanases superfamily
MPALLSGSTLRAGSANTYITLATAQPQLPATPTTNTGYTVITELVYPKELVTRYASSLGNIQFTTGTMQANLPNLNINIVGTGTGTIIVSGSVANTSSDTGVLVVKGGIGISEGIRTGKDIVVNGLSMGPGYSNQIGGVNNIVITGTAKPQLNAFPVGQESIVIGYDALKGIDTSYKVIAIGRYAASTGTQLENTIAIGDSALKNIGSTQTEFAGFISAVTAANTLTLTVLDHTLSTGTEVLIKNVVGMTELNDQTYFVSVVSTSSIRLYTDINLQYGVDASAYNGYVSGGSIYKKLLWNGNFAIGNNAGKNLINGEQNFFLGYNPAPNFTTGSYNFFMGHDIAQNMITGNANISIGGDNMIDGQDDQVNIGSVFYYNGNGYLELNADTGLGLGTESTSTISGAFNVDGGAGISGNLYVGGELHVVNPINATTTTNGALVVTGGVGIGGDVYIGGTLHATALSSLVAGSSQYADEILVKPTSSTNYYLALTTGVAGYESIYSPSDIEFDGLNDSLIVGSRIDVTNTTLSANTYSGALTVYGGVGIGEKLHVQNDITATSGDIGLGSEKSPVAAGSLVFNGADSYLTVADNLALRFGLGTFTIEAWVYRTTASVSGAIASKGSPSTYQGWLIYVTTNQIIYNEAAASPDIVATYSVPVDTWTHIAVVREGTGVGQLKIYVNGSFVTSGTSAYNFNQTDILNIGRNGRSPGAYWPGRISNLRILKGNAYYTGAFTPRIPLTAVSGTALLLNATTVPTYLVDSSANNFTVISNNVGWSNSPTYTPTGSFSFALHVNGETGYLEFQPNTYSSGISATTPALTISNNGSASTTPNPLNITNATSATTTTTGALTVVGGVGVKGSVYSQDGNPEQNYLLYTPKVTITNTGLPPSNPKPGDFWIDTQILAELQFIQDGTSTFWIQITSL